jgi:hypothetical protein
MLLSTPNVSESPRDTDHGVMNANGSTAYADKTTFEPFVGRVSDFAFERRIYTLDVK